MKLSELIDSHTQRDLTHLTTQSRRIVRDRLKIFVRYMTGIRKTELHQLSYTHIQNYIKQLQQLEISPSYSKDLLFDLKRFLKALYDQSYILIDYSQAIDVPKIKAKPRHSATITQIKAVIRKVPQLFKKEIKRLDRYAKKTVAKTVTSKNTAIKNIPIKTSVLVARNQVIASLALIEKLNAKQLQALKVEDVNLFDLQLRIRAQRRFQKINKISEDYLISYLKLRVHDMPRTDQLFVCEKRPMSYRDMTVVIRRIKMNLEGK